MVRIRGGADVVLAFDGCAYPANPCVPWPRVRPAGAGPSELLIDDFRSWEQGRPLPAAAASSPGPSFDCARATRRAERLVCADATLAGPDRDLAAVYGRGQAAASGWADAERRSERAAQRAWLAEHDRCAGTGEAADCLATLYRRRIAVLQIRNAELGPVPDPVSYRGPDLPAMPVTAVLHRNTEPSTAVLTLGAQQRIAFLERSGSGARYAAPGVELWEHHGEACLTWQGRTHACRVPGVGTLGPRAHADTRKVGR